MDKKVLILIVLIILTWFFAFKMFVHTSCKGAKGIPWWPNSGCDCVGLRLQMGDTPPGVGGYPEGSYCIGVLKEYEEK